MSESGFLDALVWAALCIFLMLFLSKRLARTLAKEEEEKPGVVADSVYRISKWLTLILLFYLGLSFWSNWPPKWMERRDQRKEVFKRVEGAGGWSQLFGDTSALLSTNDSPGLSITPRFDTNIVLPPSIAALKARDIDLHKWEGSSTAFFHIYGYHSTGGRGQAGYWLYVVAGGSEDKAIESLRSRLTRSRTIHQITNGVFEVY